MFRTAKLRPSIAALAAVASAATLALSAAAADAYVQAPVATSGPPVATKGPLATPTIGPMSEQLTVTQSLGDYYLVHVSGLVSMTQAGAQQLINSGYRVNWDLYGSDPLSDDYLFGPAPTTVQATAQGLWFAAGGYEPASLLNEDDSFFDDQDELISHANLLDPSGKIVKSTQSNEVDGYF